MKIVLLKIFAFFLLVAIATETSSYIWSKENTSVVLLDNEKKESDNLEKEESKDKFVHYPSNSHSDSQAPNHILENTFFNYSAYLSLPELPPELV